MLSDGLFYSYKELLLFQFILKLCLSTDTYHKPSAQCNVCFRSIFSDKQQHPLQKRENKSLTAIFKFLFKKPTCIRSRKKKMTLPESCSCTTASHTVSKSSDSMTFIDLPWIVPSKYHKNTNGQIADMLIACKNSSNFLLNRYRESMDIQNRLDTATRPFSFSEYGLVQPLRFLCTKR